MRSSRFRNRSVAEKGAVCRARHAAGMMSANHANTRTTKNKVVKKLFPLGRPLFGSTLHAEAWRDADFAFVAAPSGISRLRVHAGSAGRYTKGPHRTHEEAGVTDAQGDLFSRRCHRAPCSVLLVGAFKGDSGSTLSPEAAEVDSALDGRLAGFVRARAFRAEVGDVLVMPTPEIPADSVAVVGLGNKPDAGVTELRRAAGSAIRSLDGLPSVATTLHQLVPGGESESAVVEGMLLGAYRFDLYKSKAPDRHTEQIALLGASQNGIDRGRPAPRQSHEARDRSTNRRPPSTPLL